ncbi:Bgt-20456, partial [Blumeria graminis f. sp. tritici]
KSILSNSPLRYFLYVAGSDTRRSTFSGPSVTTADYIPRPQVGAHRNGQLAATCGKERCLHATLELPTGGDEEPTPVSVVPYEPPTLTSESAEPRLSNKVLTSMKIPRQYRGLYLLHFSARLPMHHYNESNHDQIRW